jgi:catechol 2,3-dioxygenase-like lactoylglutathione lyase family enzyme
MTVGGACEEPRVTESYPTIRQVVLDTEDPRGLAEVYREVFGFTYRNGDEPPPEGQPDPKGEDWLVLCDPAGHVGLAFQKVDQQPRSTWPEQTIPQMLHLDTTVPDIEELRRQHERVLALGATLLYDRSEDRQEPLYVYADPAGHPFCIFVGH